MGRNRETEQIVLDLDYQFEFGKYKYATVLHVLSIDHEYLEWFAFNVDGYALADDVEEAVGDPLLRQILLDENS